MCIVIKIWDGFNDIWLDQILLHHPIKNQKLQNEFDRILG